MIFKQQLPQTRFLFFTLLTFVALSLIYILLGSFLEWPYMEFVLALFSSLVVATATVSDSSINRSEALMTAEVSKIDEYNSLIDALFMRLNLVRGAYLAIYDAIELKKEAPTRAFVALFIHHSCYTRQIAPIEVSKFGYLPAYLADKGCERSKEFNFIGSSIFLELHSLIHDVNVVLDFIVIIDQLTEKLRNKILHDDDGVMYIENETVEQTVENTRFSICIEEVMSRVPQLEKRLVNMMRCLSESASNIFSQSALQRRCIINPIEHLSELKEYQYCELINPSFEEINEELMNRLNKHRINLSLSQ